MAHRRTTIEEIAAKAGVSTTTVSNVFNLKGRFSEHVRSRVMSAAEELRFTPNALIRSIQTRRTQMVGVRTWPGFANLTDSSISMYLQQGIAEGFVEGHYDLLNYMDFPERMNGFKAVQFLDGRVDGIILGPYIVYDEELQILADSGLPSVILYRPECPGNIASITIENDKGVEAGIRHLIELGHRRIGGYFAYSTFDMDERRQAFDQTLIQAGVGFEPGLRYNAVDYLAPLEPVIDYFIQMPNPPTALVFGDDNLALMGVDALKARGIRIPEDISVVGFDDTPKASNGVGLTTVRQPAREVGLRAAQAVVRLIQGETLEHGTVRLPVELKVRGSTSRPGGRPLSEFR